jgi:hypothetical protein
VAQTFFPFPPAGLCVEVSFVILMWVFFYLLNYLGALRQIVNWKLFLFLFPFLPTFSLICATVPAGQIVPWVSWIRCDVQIRALRRLSTRGDSVSRICYAMAGPHSHELWFFRSSSLTCPGLQSMDISLGIFCRGSSFTAMMYTTEYIPMLSL